MFNLKSIAKSFVDKVFPKEETVFEIEEIFFYGYKSHKSQEFYDDMSSWMGDTWGGAGLAKAFYFDDFVTKDGKKLNTFVFGIPITKEDIDCVNKKKVCKSHKAVTCFGYVLEEVPPYFQMTIKDAGKPEVISAFVLKEKPKQQTSFHNWFFV